jgi:hypothetical protein
MSEKLNELHINSRKSKHKASRNEVHELRVCCLTLFKSGTNFTSLLNASIMKILSLDTYRTALI